MANLPPGTRIRICPDITAPGCWPTMADMAALSTDTYGKPHHGRTITAGQAQDGDVVLDSAGKAWQRGAGPSRWSTFDGPVSYYGPWDDAYGPQGDLILIARDGKPHPVAGS